MKKKGQKAMKKSVGTRQNNNNQKIRPLGDRVIIRPILNESATQSGIIIPETASKEKPERGVVVAVGNGRYDSGKLVPVGVKIGDKVIFSKYSVDEIKVDGEDLLVVSEGSIIAVI